MMKSFQPTATNEELINCLLSSANDDIYNLSSNILGSMGTGRLDAQDALLCIKPNCTNPTAFTFSSNPEICPNETVELTASDGISFNWSTGETTQSIDIIESGTFTVTVTIDGGCTATSSIDIIACPESACLCSNTNSINIGIDDDVIRDFTSLAGIPPTTSTSFSCVTITGKVRFDLPLFSFFNCDIYMSPGAEIIVPDGSIVNFFMCNIQGCSQMWRGIVAESGSEVILRKSSISDAQYAITAHHNSNFTNEENIFDRNFVGIYATPPLAHNLFGLNNINQTISTSTFVIPFGQDKGNRFLCTSNLSTPYPGQTPAPGNITFAGILLYSVNYFEVGFNEYPGSCLLYTSPSPRDATLSRMPSSA